MTPYYDRDGITIYHGDCREVLPTLDPVDLVLTDPPYGIQSKWVGGSGHGWAPTSKGSTERAAWDGRAPTVDTIQMCIAKGKNAIVWGGNYFGLRAARCWLVWSKPERDFTLAEAELAWTTYDKVVRVFDWKRHTAGRVHPTQKPIALFKWCIESDKSVRTILDPFMGSGTTLRAAKDLGRQAIGIELEERYCEIAAERLRQGVLQFA